MFEDCTYERILNRMLSRVPSDLDKREGSVIYDAVAPAAVELQLMYIELDNIINEMFANTASREYLIRRGAERGLAPKEATAAILRGEFSPPEIDVLGKRFNLEELNYSVISKISDGVYELECETSGSIGNEKLGRITPIEHIEGLKSAVLTEVLVYGEDEEETENFRQRYYDSINNLAFGGNVADYKEKVGAMEGVGGVRVYRADDWLGAGTVKVIITSSENTAPTKELVNRVKEELDPADYTGDGIGLAPIGHQVTVMGAESFAVNVELTITVRANADNIKETVKNAVRGYIESINKTWESDKTSKIYISGIIADVKAVAEVIDVYDVKLNGAESNLVITGDYVAAAGEISIETEEV